MSAMKTLSGFMTRTALLLFLPFLLALLPGGVVLAAGQPPVRIGAVFSLIGKGNFVGPLVGGPMRWAAKAVADDLNRKGGVLGRQIELFVEDDHADPEAAAAATLKLIKERKVSIVIGPSNTSSTGPMVRVCEQEQVPLIVTNPAVTPFQRWVFHLGAGEVRGAQHMAGFAARTLLAKRIAVLHDSSDYGVEGGKYLLESFKRHPEVTVVAQGQFDPTEKSMLEQLSNIGSANPDLIVLYTNGPEAAIMAKAYRQMGITTPVLGSHGVPTTDFLRLAGETAEKYRWVMLGSEIAIADKLPANDPYRRDLYDPFVKLMKAKYKRLFTKPSVYQAAAYDGIMVAVQAIKEAGTDNRADVRNALEQIRWKGFTGSFACTPLDHQGSPADTSPAIAVRGGAYAPYKR